MSDNGGVSCCEQWNVSDSVKILSGVHTVNLKPFLTGLLKAWIIAFDFSPERTNLFKGNTVTVNRKSVIIGKRNILGTALVLLSVVPIYMIAWTNRGFGLLERTAVFLPCSAAIVGFTFLVHGKPRFAKGMTGGKLFRVFGALRKILCKKESKQIRK